MSRKQAKLFWNSLTIEQKQDFNRLMEKMDKKELMLEKVCVDDNEQIQRIILKPKNPISQQTAPFASHFNLKD
jgi:hypothetical protein